jgi:hypothetical protein
MISLELTEKPDLNWNKRLLNSPTGNVYQTIELGKFIETTKSGKPAFLKFFDEKGEIIAQLLFSQYSLLDQNNTVRKFQNFKNFYYKKTYKLMVLKTHFTIILTFNGKNLFVQKNGLLF